jgi:cyclopropane-fatty-acyl-phospholipid synthase
MPKKSSIKQLCELLALAKIELNGNNPWDLKIVNNDAVDLIIEQGSVGLGESYMNNWWSCDALDEFSFRIFNADIENNLKLNINVMWNIVKSRLINLQNIFSAKKVAHTHYNLSDELFITMLDSTMAYSCAYWKNASTLEEAQLDKYDLICKKLQLGKEDSLLDIGCGWGGLSAYCVAKFCQKALSISNSSSQILQAKNKYAKLPIEFLCTDYRNTHLYNKKQNQFDKIVSVGFFEHVGYKNYKKLFKIISQQLKDNGIFLLHTIGTNQSQTITDPWINKYIFPNSMLPSMGQICGALEDYFIVEDWHNFGPDYDKTLMAWHENFERNWHSIKDNFDNTFYFMWRYYLLMSAGMFRARRAQLWQIVLSKPGFIPNYSSIR